MGTHLPFYFDFGLHFLLFIFITEEISDSFTVHYMIRWLLVLGLPEDGILVEFWDR